MGCLLGKALPHLPLDHRIHCVNALPGERLAHILVLVWKPDVVLVVVLALVDCLSVDSRHFHWVVN